MSKKNDPSRGRYVHRGFRGINVFASTTVELDECFVGDVTETDGEERLRLAENARTSAKVRTLVFLELLRGEGKE